MDLQEFKKYCLQKKGTSEDFPFDEKTLVLKVGSKMFALTNIKEEKLKINLKCEPLMSVDLRREYPAIAPGFHMNKKHWNTLEIDGSLPEETVKMLIDISYDLVFKGLKKTERDAISASK